MRGYPEESLERVARRELAHAALRYAAAYLVGDASSALDELVDAAKTYHAAITEEPGAGAGFAPARMLRARSPRSRSK